jgi:hypothetical protein
VKTELVQNINDNEDVYKGTLTIIKTEFIKEHGS